MTKTSNVARIAYLRDEIFKAKEGLKIVKQDPHYDAYLNHKIHFYQQDIVQHTKELNELLSNTLDFEIKEAV